MRCIPQDKIYPRPVGDTRVGAIELAELADFRPHATL